MTDSPLATKPKMVTCPTKYTPELLQKAESYIENYKEHEHKIPSVAGLSLVLDINRKTLYEWAKDDDKIEISNILRRLSDSQEQVLLSNGLDNTFNSTITKLVLSKHGYSDKPTDNTPTISITINRDSVDVSRGTSSITIDNDTQVIDSKE